MDKISVMLVESLISSPDVFAEGISFINQTRQNFVETTLRHTVPALILSRNRQCLAEVASIVKRSLGMVLMENTEPILTGIFLSTARPESCLAFLVGLIRQHVGGSSAASIDSASLMTTCIVPLIVALVIELGDEDTKVSTNAINALQRAYSTQKNVAKTDADLGPFFKPHMLGVMTHLNETLHDMRGKKSVEYKRKLIRSLRVLIELVGDSIASYSPQVSVKDFISADLEIMASLQSSLGAVDLRQATLKTLLVFISTLRYSDIGPFVGQTTAALVAHWPEFGEDDRKVVCKIIEEIAGNASQLAAYLDDIVGLDHIPDLRQASSKLVAARKQWKFPKALGKLLVRVRSKNTAIATASIRELRELLLREPVKLANLSKGDTFHPLLATALQSLLASVSPHSGDHEWTAFCDAAYECLGIIGAVDPDRVNFSMDTPTMLLISNFADGEESVEFALHLIRDLLVDAFRATTDTKLQAYLAYAIQELLKFCGFSLKLLQGNGSGAVPLKTRNRWNNLPKDQHETLTPLLESRFTLYDGPSRQHVHPIYSHIATYREWIQIWTSVLIDRVLALIPEARAIRDSQEIFGVFRGVLRNQDVAVAHHILPHLVLHVLLSGGQGPREEITMEINAVLRDQVSPNQAGSADRRSLSAQVVFDLMDHLSKWLRLQRGGAARTEKMAQQKAVESVLASIEGELMANAALQSQAYARALRGFENRIVRLRRDHKANSDLQTYFEKLHLIYAKLEEPDGMEGVSTFVISPSLEHQIREHESTGRWTSAQSCWEVKLQHFPDDVSLHRGLLHCLKNLGHYGEFRPAAALTSFQIPFERTYVGYFTCIPSGRLLSPTSRLSRHG